MRTSCVRLPRHFLRSTFPNFCPHDAPAVGGLMPVCHMPLGLQPLEPALRHLTSDVSAPAHAAEIARAMQDGVHLLRAPDGSCQCGARSQLNGVRENPLKSVQQRHAHTIQAGMARAVCQNTIKYM